MEIKLMGAEDIVEILNRQIQVADSTYGAILNLAVFGCDLLEPEEGKLPDLLNIAVALQTFYLIAGLSSHGSSASWDEIKKLAQEAADEACRELRQIKHCSQVQPSSYDN